MGRGLGDFYLGSYRLAARLPPIQYLCQVTTKICQLDQTVRLGCVKITTLCNHIMLKLLYSYEGL